MDAVPCELAAAWWRRRPTVPVKLTPTLAAFIERRRVSGKYSQTAAGLYGDPAYLHIRETRITTGDEVTVFGAIDEPRTSSRGAAYRDRGLRTLGLWEGKIPIISVR